MFLMYFDNAFYLFGTSNKNNEYKFIFLLPSSVVWTILKLQVIIHWLYTEPTYSIMTSVFSNEDVTNNFNYYSTSSLNFLEYLAIVRKYFAKITFYNGFLMDLHSIKVFKTVSVKHFVKIKTIFLLEKDHLV